MAKNYIAHVISRDDHSGDNFNDNFMFQNSVLPFVLASLSGFTELGNQHVLRGAERSYPHLLHHGLGKICLGQKQILQFLLVNCYWRFFVKI